MIKFSEDEDDEKDVAEKEAAEKEAAPKGFIQRMLETRTILLFGEINQKIAKEVSQNLMLLAAENDDPIKLFINSQGGHVESGDTIFDMIRFVKPEVKIIGTGWVASAGALIYASTAKENRFSLPNTRYMIHQPMGGIRGQASDIAIEAEEIMKMRERLNMTFADQTGQTIEQVREDTLRNYWMSALEAQKYGLVSKIINTIDELD
ncbi:MAG: ATP-dependent Clp protease protease subunit [Cellvibrionaceae bacterium]